MAELSRSERIQGWSFLLVGAGLVAGVVALLSGFGGTEDVRTYTVVFDKTVAGIGPRTQVMFLGVPCGEVTQVRLLDNPGRDVQVTIAVEPWTPVTETTTAKVSMQSLVGRFHLELGDVEKPGPPAGSGFTIPGSSSALSSLADAGEGVSEQVLDVLSNVREMTSAENRKAISAALDNANAMMKAVAKSLNTLTDPTLETLRSVEGLSEEARVFLRDQGPSIQAILKDGQRVLGTLEELLADPAIARLPRTFEDELLKTGASARDALNTLSAWLDANKLQPELAKATQALEQVVGRIDGLATTIEKEGLTLVRGELTPTARRLRETLVSLERFLSAINRNPRGVLLGGPANEKPLPGRGAGHNR